MTKLIDRVWNETHARTPGRAGGTDRMAVTMTVDEYTGRMKEVVVCNGAVIVANEYPANTPYAQRRIAKWTI
jgi:hypothetical protein